MTKPHTVRNWVQIKRAASRYKVTTYLSLYSDAMNRFPRIHPSFDLFRHMNVFPAHERLTCRSSGGSSQYWLTSIVAPITWRSRSSWGRDRVLKECWDSEQHWLTSISVSMRSGQTGQRVLEECCHSAQCFLTSISTVMTSALSGKSVVVWSSLFPSSVFIVMNSRTVQHVELFASS